MALDDVLKAGINHQTFQGENISQAIDYTQSYNQVMNYLQETGRYEKLVDKEGRINPEVLGAAAAGMRKETTAKLEKTVSDNYKGIVSSLGEEELGYLTVKYGMSKDTRDLAEKLEKKDQKSLRAMYLKEIEKDEILASTFAFLTDSNIEAIMQRKLRNETNELVVKNLYTETEKGKYSFDANKARKYVQGILEKLGDKEKKPAYIELGHIYLQMEARKKAEEEAKKKEKK